MLALALLGRRFVTPLLEGRARRRAALSPVTGTADQPTADNAKFTSVRVGATPVRPAYGGGGIDVELNDNADAALEASQMPFNPFTDNDSAGTDTSHGTDDAADTADSPAAAPGEHHAPRVSLRPSSADDSVSDFDNMLDELEKTERFEAPRLNTSADTGKSGKSRLLEETGTMRSLFEETHDNDETADLPFSDNPTVDMVNRADEVTAELPEMPSAADTDTTDDEVVDIDITDLESLSRRLADDGDDALSATLTQALDLLEKDYEEEFTQSQLLEKEEVARAFAEHKKD
ncbi:MAG: hypothetical protein D6744_11450 [Planctomycetota bacterium]|nr:MAG: hypothetical protein D6744_11450 [Planctomycetota bacterium]